MLSAEVHTVLLSVHVPGGVVGLMAGPAALIGGRRSRRAAASTYQVAVLLLAVTGCGLALLDPRRLWWLAPIAIATEVLAVGGWWQARRTRGGPPSATQVRLLGASYVSLVTATTVVSVGGPLSWAVPSVIGAAVVEAAAKGPFRSDGRGRDGERVCPSRV